MGLRREIEMLRGPRNPVDPERAGGAWIESEPDGCGGTVSVATILLTVSECPWRCAMCDLWKNTLQQPTPRGAVVRQIERALQQLGGSPRWIKIYNSGSFFDRHSIPPADHAAIASICCSFDRVVIENHPRLSTPSIRTFRDQIGGQLEIAIGVETLQPGMLRRLNKGMNRDDIDRAIALHASLGIDTRAFVVVRPPWTDEAEAVAWTELTVRHLARHGVRHTSLIPMRFGSGWLEQKARENQFAPPSIRCLETAMNRVFAIRNRGVVTADLWEGPPPKACPHCRQSRWDRLLRMNLTQQSPDPVLCEHCDGDATE
jgi:radical SAM enzyme (TIGR01210 family)